MNLDSIITVVITALVTGGFSTFATVTSLKVHINYLKEGINRQEKSINRAHERIDDIEKG